VRYEFWALLIVSNVPQLLSFAAELQQSEWERIVVEKRTGEETRPSSVELKK
jgi:hypothetical protein